MARPENKYSKLTPEQQEFAEKHYYLIYGYLRKRNLPQGEYYGLIAICFIKAVRIYFMRENLHKFPFSTIFWRRAQAVEIGYRRSLEAQKRIQSRDLRSLNIQENRDVLEYKIMQSVEPLWDDIEYRDLIDRICQCATDRQCSILKLRLSGQKNAEITKTIGISMATLSRDVYDLKKQIIESGILEPRCTTTKG